MSIDTEKLHQLQDWYHTPLGRALAVQEQEKLNIILSRLFGYHLIQLGHINDCNLFEESPINHKLKMSFEPTLDSERYSLAANLYELPLQSDSVDVVLLPHLLEFVEHPKLLLDEVSRILIPEGHIIIMGFNPMSQWGLWHLLKKRRKKVPWSGHFRGIYRNRALLSDLGCEVTDFETFFFRPPVSNRFILKHSAFLESLGSIGWPYLGGAYLMLAQKKVSTLTPIKPRLRFRDMLHAKAVVEPTTRSLR